MNHAIRQAILPLLSGEVRSTVCKGLLVNPRFTIFVDKFQFNRPFVRGFKSNQQLASGSSDEDDEFNELGPTVDEVTKLGSPQVQTVAAPLKLMTEKPENFKRSGIFRNILLDLSNGNSSQTSSPKADNNKRGKTSATDANNKKDSKSKIATAANNQKDSNSKILTDAYHKVDSNSKIVIDANNKKKIAPFANNKKDLNSKFDTDANNKEDSNSKMVTVANDRKYSDLMIPSYVRIDNVPSTISLSQLSDAIATYGNVSSVSMKTLPNGVICCYVKFEQEKSWKRLISEGSIAVGKGKLSVSAVCGRNSVTFRIKSIRKDTETDDIQSTCNSLGQLEYLDRVNKNVAYAVFTSMDESETQSLLAKLNSVSFEGCAWAAEVQVAEYSKDDDALEYSELKSKISNDLHKLRNEAMLKVIDAEDLENLHSSIMAIEDQVQTTCA